MKQQMKQRFAGKGSGKCAAPSGGARGKRQKTSSFDRRISRILVASLAMLPAFISEPAAADDLYVSGGGGGGGGAGSYYSRPGGTGGDKAGSGGDGGGGGGGGGAYVGNGTGTGTAGASNGNGGAGYPNDNESLKGENADGESGGGGGNAIVTNPHDFEFDTVKVMAGSGGGGSQYDYYEVFGGKGGNASLTVKADFTVNTDLVINAGSGGGADGTSTPSHVYAGGDGGVASLVVEGGDLSVKGDTFIEAGAGGNGDGVSSYDTFFTREGNYNNGGKAILDVSGKFNVDGSVNIIAGSAGTLISGVIGSGDGGDVSIIVGDSFNVGNTLNIASGQDSVTSAGGKVELSAEKLIARTINLTKKDGDLTVDVGTLDVTKDIALALNGTITGVGGVGNAGVFFENIDIAGGKKLTVTRKNSDGTETDPQKLGDYAFKNLNVLGTGAIYDGKLDATNATFNFYLQDIAPNDVLLTALTGDVTTDDTTTIRLHSNQALSKLQVGDSITLIDATDSGSTLTVSESTWTLEEGLTDYRFNRTATPNVVEVMLNGITIAPSAPAHTRPLSQGFLTGMVFLDQGADFLISHGIPAILRAQSGNAPNGLDLFAVLGGSHLKYKTGSHIDLNGETMIVGITATRPIPTGRLTLGPFVEYGEGRYDTHDRPLGAEHIHGTGKARYTGGGLLAHMKFDETNLGHFYTQASARGGKIDLDSSFSTSRLPDACTFPGTCEIRSTYGSAHFAVGRVIRLGETVFEFYGQALRGRQAADTVKLGADSKVEFDPIVSSRTRVGARWTRTFGPNTQFTLGAAWEREHDGKAKARLRIGGDSVPIDPPKLKGDTGIFEAGFTLTPTRTSPWTLEFGVQGHVGQRQGVTGSFRVNYGF